MANIKMVAQLAKVSPATVSNVFTKKKSVSEETRNRVLKVCKELNYMPSVLASSMITKQTNFYGFFVQTNNSTYGVCESEMIRGASTASLKYEKKLILYLDTLNTHYLKSVLQVGYQPIDGAIITLPQFLDQRIKELSANTIPYVIIGTPFNMYDSSSYVDSDNTKIAYNLTRHMIEKGHSRIVMINYKEGFTVTQNRFDGYAKAHSEAKLPINPELTFNTGINEEDGFECIQQLLQKKIFFSSVITSMPEVAAGVYAALKQYGLNIGEDISVASINSDSNQNTPALTTGIIDYAALGEMAAELVYRLQTNPGMEPQHILVENTYLFTESCQKFNPKLYEKFCLL